MKIIENYSSHNTRPTHRLGILQAGLGLKSLLNDMGQTRPKVHWAGPGGLLLAHPSLFYQNAVKGQSQTHHIFSLPKFLTVKQVIRCDFKNTEAAT